MRIVTVKLPEELDRLLESLARKQGTTRSAVIRRAIEAYARERAWGRLIRQIDRKPGCERSFCRKSAGKSAPFPDAAGRKANRVHWALMPSWLRK